VSIWSVIRNTDT